MILVNKVVEKLKLSKKTYFYQKCAPKQVFNEKKFRKIRMIFDTEIQFERVILTLFDDQCFHLTTVNFWPTILLFRAQPACWAKSKY